MGAERRCDAECLHQCVKCGYYTLTIYLRSGSVSRHVEDVTWEDPESWVSCLVSGRAVCSSSSRVGQRTDRGREKGRGKTGYLKMWTTMPQGFFPKRSNVQPLIYQMLNYLHDTSEGLSSFDLHKSSAPGEVVALWLGFLFNLSL